MKRFETTVIFDEQKNEIAIPIPSMKQLAMGRRITHRKKVRFMVPDHSTPQTATIEIDFDYRWRVMGISLKDFKLQIAEE